MNFLLATASADSSFDWTHYCELLAGVIAWVGVAVLVYGVARSAVSFVRIELTGSPQAGRHRLRMDLGYYLLLGLEILVAADVIETLVAPDLEHVMVLGAIVLIRTVISFSLNWELARERQDSPSPASAGSNAGVPDNE